MPVRPFRLLALAAPLLAAAGALAQPGAPSQPEGATGFAPRAALQARREMVATANPHASAAAMTVLARGGGALDAAIAAQMVLTLVEPQSSGIGGGAFLLHRDGRSNAVVAWDGRETAPAGADERLFLGPDGKPLAFFDAVVGGRSVGVPGVVRMLEAAHARHGRLPWATLFEPAIRLATEGFEVSPRLHALLASERHLKRDASAARHFYAPDGTTWPVGHRLRNPELADTLARIAREGSLALHAGPIAREIVDAVRGHPTNPGRLGERDLAFYAPIAREALCTPYRRWVVCGMPPPSSGGIAVAQILGILEAARAPALAGPDGVPRVDGVHAFAEAGALAFADRGRWLADPAFVAPPAGLVAPRYLAARAAAIGERAMGRARPGSPDGAPRAAADEATLEQPSTSHLSIVDARGDAVAMTTTIEDQFGARIMVRGFLLNNQLSDFSFAAIEDGAPVANRVEPGKRPRSSMAPTLVFERAGGPDDAPRRGALAMSLGSPGGSQIIGYVARTLLLTLRDGHDLQAAIAMPNLGSRNGPVELEAGRAPAGLAAALRERGHEVREIPMTSGLQGIVRRCDAAGRCTLVGGADPRREGVVLGR
ncbi:MAG: gamma-glutamyltransferase family protein [Burkholderiaceae bacterium]|jgi:gamma-glutamyltranspeptidase/glutathione hydrolase|nr:gamma-glutamyltransferase family protein [Burkholderiales bacterium]MCZ8338941.1 gamma-glutamyltransferase family protein [Burkholderiaceae bacterium]